MRVLVDARSLGERATSNRTYWAGLIDALGRRGDVEIFLASDVPLDFGALAPNARVVVQPARSGRWFSLVELPRMARRLGADVVHVQYTVSPLFRTPVVTMVHDVSYFIEPAWFGLKDRLLLRRSVPASCRRAARVVVPSETCRRELLEYIPLPEGKVMVTPEGAPTGLVGLGAGRREGVYALLAGGASPRKNLKGAVEVVRRARERAPEMRLLVTGRVPEAELAAWVDAPGPLSEVDLAAAYRGAVALLHPSFHEGFGLTILEAMTLGCPVVASDRGAIPEVAGDAAILCGAEDAAGMAEGLVRMMEPGLREEMVARGLRRAAGFTWDETAARTVEAYRAAVGASSV